MDIGKVNLFKNPAAMSMQGLNPVQKPVEQPIQPTQAVGRGSNPFAENKNEKMGVGLVQSNLQNMSYALPNGKTSNCNTRWIG